MIGIGLLLVSPVFVLMWNLCGVHRACFGRSFCLSRGDHDCTYSNRHMSNRTADCLL